MVRTEYVAVGDIQRYHSAGSEFRLTQITLKKSNLLIAKAQ